MPSVSIEASGCRACTMCADVCPTDVFDMGPADDVAVVAREGDCIGCTSCEYICPSRCLKVGEVERQRPFHRIEQNSNIVAKLLQRAPLRTVLADDDLEEAQRDVAVRLRALAASVTETMGRGHRVVGRTAGGLAAEHLPEAYEETTIEGVLERLKRRFAGCFDFDADIDADGRKVAVCFRGCALVSVVEAGGETPGQATLCALFHEYWAGLLSAFSGQTYALDNQHQSGACTIQLQRKG